MPVSTVHDARVLLKDYQRLMKQGCVFGTLLLEISDCLEWCHDRLIWTQSCLNKLKGEVDSARFKKMSTDFFVVRCEVCDREAPGEITVKVICQYIKDIYKERVVRCEVCDREAPVLGVIDASERYLLRDPDTRLLSHLSNLQHSWSRLLQDLRSLSRQLHLHNRNNPSDLHRNPVLSRQLHLHNNKPSYLHTGNNSSYLHNRNNPSDLHNRNNPSDLHNRNNPSDLHPNLVLSRQLHLHNRNNPSYLHPNPLESSLRKKQFLSSRYKDSLSSYQKFPTEVNSVQEESTFSLVSNFVNEISTPNFLVTRSTPEEHFSVIRNPRLFSTKYPEKSILSPISEDTVVDANPSCYGDPRAKPSLACYCTLDDLTLTTELPTLTTELATMDHCVPDINDSVLLSPRSPKLCGSPKRSPLMKPKLHLNPGNDNHVPRSPPGTPPRTRPSPSVSEDEDDEMRILAKRRKLNSHSPSYSPSPCGTPADFSLNSSMLNLASTDTSFDEGLTPTSLYLQADMIDNMTDTSGMSSPAISPSPTMTFQNGTRKGLANFRGRYKKDELWPAIEGNYQFLMDEEIIETCKSTESDLSWESDDVTAAMTTVSFMEFLQQYKELTDWLNHIQIVTERQCSSLSEKYLNQTYHEEMLQRSPRRKLFNDYSKQLMRRFPERKEDVVLRLQHLNKQWEALEKAISPSHDYQDQQTMLNDLEQDLVGLRKWLHDVENRLQPLTIKSDWTTNTLQIKLMEHQQLQRDLQAHSKIVSAVLKLCERLYESGTSTLPHGGAEDKKLLAVNLERRWHAILLQALEWQCQLEEAIKHGIKQRPILECYTPDSDDNLSAFTSYSTDHSTLHCTAGDSDISTSSGDTNDDGVDSDNSNFDVIPFSESEYEKITVDTDIQTDEFSDDKGTISSSVAIPGRKRQSPERCEGPERGGTDSALGRSVSDHSLNTDQRAAIYHSAIKLSHDKINQAVTKAAASRDMLSMRDRHEPMEDSARERAPRPVSLRVESHDVGYSSESHSNEEQDYRYPHEINGNIVNEDYGIQTRIDSLDREGNNVLKAGLRKQGTKTTNLTWRHSMTSAYDTSSNCSDHNNSHDDQDGKPMENGSPVRHFMEGPRILTPILSSPSQSFYQMTTIETDSEATSTADRQIHQDGVRSGAATDAESELSKSLELPYDDTPVRYDDAPVRYDGSNPISSGVAQSKVRTNLDGVYGRNSHPGSPAQVVPHVNRNVLSDGDQSMDEEPGNVVSDCGESNALFDMEGFRSNKSRSREVDPVSLDSKSKVDQGCVNKLLQQATLLAQDSDQWRHKSSSWNDGVHKTRHNHRNHDSTPALNQSFNSTDGSVLPTDDSVPSGPSACEASCEGSSSSESDGEFSGTSSGSESEDAPYNSSMLQSGHSNDNTLCGSPLHSRTLLRGSSSALMGQSLLRRKIRHKHKQFSSSSTDELNARYSVSESAIFDIKSQLRSEPSLHKLRRTTSEMSAGLSQRQSTPKRIRRRRLRRAGSDESSSKLSISPIKLALSQSLPSSRRHSSRSHSRSQSPSCLQKDNPQATSDECNTHIIHQGDVTGGSTLLEVNGIPIPGRETDDTDAVHHSLNSAAEFSENAWDNLHHIYPSISSDPGEEKLDASEFQKDWDLDGHGLSDNSHLAPPSSGLENKTSSAPDKNKVRTKDKRLSSSKLSSTQSYAEDSDSDWEEVKSVMDDSRKALNFTENTLRKFRKDNMETGIFIDPSEYDGPLATCTDYVACLEEIRNLLGMKTGLDTDDLEIRDIDNMINKWQDLGALARERQKQSSRLAAIYQDLVSLKTSLVDISGDLNQDCFESVQDLEQAVKALQEHKMSLRHKYEVQVAALVERLADFEDEFPDLKMARFDEELALLQHRLDTALEKCTVRAAELQAVMLSWYDFSETRRELNYLLGQEKRHLACLDGTEDVITQLLNDQELQDMMHDLKALDEELALYENKIASMRASQAEIAKVYSQSAHKDMRTHLDDIDSTMNYLRSHCQNMVTKITTKLTSMDKETQVALAMEKVTSDARLSGIAEMDSLIAVPAGRSSLLWRLLKLALPISLAVVISFSLLCLYDPQYCESLNRFGLVFNPHLRYVDGPPPT